jgi:hypothetical protein
MRLISRFSTAITLSASVAAVCLLAGASAASASTRQIAIIQDGTQLQADVPGTLAKFRELGATTVRVVVFWYYVAPKPTASKVPAGFNGSDPNAYPAAGWAPYDQILQDAKQDGLTVDFTVAGGAPTWADGPGIPSKNPNYHNAHFAWKPNAKLYGQFVHAVGERYDGHFTPKGASSALPAVHFWALWNEPNFGEDLGPQAINGSTVSVAPMYYRGLVSAGWHALQQTGHGHDTILIGEFAARGLSGKVTKGHPEGLPGDAAQTKPLQFIRTLYCVGSNYKPLSGKIAKAEGCTASKGRFRSQNPGLFNASGVGDHPYPGSGSPVTDGRNDPDFAAFPDLPNLEKVLDKVNRIYGSHKKYSIYNDEYGYITHPPARAPYVSPATAAYYINWAEYLSWKSPRIQSYMQYLLYDPAPNAGPYAGFASGLYTYQGQAKVTLPAYELPVYMPKTSFRARQAAEVWGEARPAQFMNLDSHQPQRVAIQFQPGGHGAFSTLQTVTGNGYFDVHTKFSTSGNVRLSYTYPAQDTFLPVGVAGTTINSRAVAIRVH